MIGIVSRVEEDGRVWLRLAILPGQEPGPLPTVRHRYVDTLDDGDTEERFTTYKEGDRVYVVEDQEDAYVVLGIVEAAP